MNMVMSGAYIYTTKLRVVHVRAHQKCAIHKTRNVTSHNTTKTRKMGKESKRSLSELKYQLICMLLIPADQLNLKSFQLNDTTS